MPFLSGEFDLSIPYSHERKSHQNFAPTKTQKSRMESLLKHEIMFIEEARHICGSVRFG